MQLQLESCFAFAAWIRRTPNYSASNCLGGLLGRWNNYLPKNGKEKEASLSLILGEWNFLDLVKDATL